MRFAFAKYEGLGNDFLVLDAEAGESRALQGGSVRALCDRHRGVGADGVIATGLREGRPFMKVRNADGSTPEMCGNGVRCAVLHLARTGRVTRAQVTVDTDAGPHLCRILESGRVGTVEVQMRAPSFDPAEVPVGAEAPLLDRPLRFGEREVHITALSMGNPHAVTFDDVGEARLTLGPAIERDARFPQGVNVGFARVEPAGGIMLHVWERGAGWTRACGTGACAAAVAAVATGRVERGRAVAVELPGGTLSITVAGEGEPVLMGGPARHVFDGEIELEGAAS